MKDETLQPTCETVGCRFPTSYAGAICTCVGFPIGNTPSLTTIWKVTFYICVSLMFHSKAGGYVKETSNKITLYY